jgi:phospholipid/cholesterol/gamma-HCH transport system substrate-binding protein
MHTKTIEVGVGIFVALGLAALFMLAMKVSNLSALAEGEGYQVKAHFTNVGGLNVRAPVTMAGVRLGRVTDIQFDEERYEAVVTMTIQSQYDQLPEDTSASIYTAGLLGEQYVGLEAGGSDQYLHDGDRIQLTQSAIVLERLIGQFLFSRANEGGFGGN